ncbi:MAG: N-acetylmuramoyl-L-alanine amidase [Desulfurellales bacterium]|nr:MAG: N-acetylmuramoyl-L-alanine amidase [Desulfurellales bacterium]
MGAYWLHNFPAEAAKRGLKIELYPGWELRSRSTGGLDGIWGVCMHHTASPPSTNPNDPANRMYHMWQSSDVKPIGNFYLSRDGTITLGAAGAANTQGAGGPLPTSRGTVPLDAGNRYYIAIEAANNGIGEIWPEIQIEAYLKLVWALCDVYDLEPLTDVIFHQTWAPNRKIDPAGPTPSRPSWGGTSGGKTWNLSAVRSDVANYGTLPTYPPSTMSDFKITNPVRIVDTREGTSFNPHKTELNNTILTIKPHYYGAPQGANGVILNVTAVSSVAGYVVFWDGVKEAPLASNISFNPGVVSNTMVWVPTAPNTEKTFKVYTPQRGHVIIDQVGWFVNG